MQESRGPRSAAAAAAAPWEYNSFEQLVRDFRRFENGKNAPPQIRDFLRGVIDRVYGPRRWTARAGYDEGTDSGVPADVRAELAEIAEPRRVGAGELLVEAGTEGARDAPAFIVCYGLAEMTRPLPQRRAGPAGGDDRAEEEAEDDASNASEVTPAGGRARTRRSALRDDSSLLSLRGGGRRIGCASAVLGDPLNYDVRALTDLAVIALPREALQDIALDSTDLLLHLLRAANDFVYREAAHLDRLLLLSRQHKGPARIGAYLYRVAEAIDIDAAIGGGPLVPDGKDPWRLDWMTKAKLVRQLGVSRDTVDAALTDLASKGLIAFETVEVVTHVRGRERRRNELRDARLLPPDAPALRLTPAGSLRAGLEAWLASPKNNKRTIPSPTSGSATL